MKNNKEIPSMMSAAAVRLFKKRLSAGALYAVLGMSALAFLAPILWMFLTSLKTAEQVYTWPPVILPPQPQWKNYVDAMTFAPFGRYYINSFFLCACVVIGTLLSNTLIAYGFSRIKWPGRDLVFIIVLATLMLPFQVTMIPVYIIFKKLGWVGTFLPLIVPAFFGNAYYIFLLRQFFRGIPYELSDAARIDGCSELGILWHIILPLSKPAIVTVALLSFLGTWNDFLGPLIYLHDERFYTVTLGLQSFISRIWTPMEQMMAASTVAVIPILIIFLLAQKYFVEGINLTGLGGR
jgi:multiple sugar transport system permease protein